jgi:prepilin-type N-terminal cleavage/methylation domain-containing protein
MKNANKAQRGFSLIEVMVSAAIMTVGLLTLLGVFGLAMASTQTAQEDMIARQLGNEAMESIFTARDTSQTQWDSIQNVSAGGIFLDNPQFLPINQPGPDGILGTADDSNAGTAYLTEPGPDGLVGTADDIKLPLTNYQRAIAIQGATDALGNPNPNLRSVTITIQYSVPQRRSPKQYVLTGYISRYR